MNNIKKTLSLFIILTLLASISSQSSAAASTNTVRSVAEYDLSTDETQTYILKDTKNEIYYCMIEPISASPARLKNGSYRVTHTVPQKWKASFIVKISSNKISSVSSPSAVAIQGSIKNVSLKKTSSTNSTLTFIHTLRSIPQYTGFKCYLSNGTLKTQKI